MSQCERIISNIERFGSIDPMSALVDIGVFRLAARVNDLKKDGHCIKSEMVTVQNRFGEYCRVARYSLDLERTLADAITCRANTGISMEKRNELTAKIANLRTRVERMKGVK